MISIVDKVLLKKNCQSLCLVRTHTLDYYFDYYFDHYFGSLVFDDAGKQANTFVWLCRMLAICMFYMYRWLQRREGNKTVKLLCLMRSG